MVHALLDPFRAGGMAMGFVVMPNFEDNDEDAEKVNVPPLNRLFKSIPSSAILVCAQQRGENDLFLFFLSGEG